jgi:hypothetical protein
MGYRVSGPDIVILGLLMFGAMPQEHRKIFQT